MRRHAPQSDRAHLIGIEYAYFSSEEFHVPFICQVRAHLGMNERFYDGARDE